MRSILAEHNITLAVRLLWSREAAPPLDLTIMASTDLIWQGRQGRQPSMSDKSLEKILLNAVLILNGTGVKVQL